MKFLSKLLMAFSLGFALVSCATTTTDPVVGKADFQTLESWTKSVEGSLDLEKAIAEVPANADAMQARAFLEKKVATQFDAARTSAKALNLRHTDVIQMRDYYLESFDLMQQAVNLEIRALTGADVEQLKQEMSPIISRLETLDAQGNALMEKLDTQFGTP